MAFSFCAETALALLFHDRTRADAPQGVYADEECFDSASLATWAADHDLPLYGPLHVASPSAARGRRPRKKLRAGYRIVFHLVPSEVFGDDFLSIDGALVARPELCFVQMATRLSVVDLALLGYKMCGDYRGSDQRFQSKELPLTSVKKLAQFIDSHPGKWGVAKARQALPLIVDGSNSHMEARLSLFALMPLRRGGSGVPRAFLNKKVRGLGRTADLFWPDAKLVLEYDSDENHDGSNAETRDALRRMQIEGRSIHVISVRRAQLTSPRRLDELARALRASFGLRTKKLTSAQREQRDKLAFLLFHRPSSRVIDFGKD